MEIFPLKPEAFGLDISDLSLKIMKLKKTNKGIEPECFGYSEIPPGVIEEGEIKNEEKLVEILKETMKIGIKKVKLKTKYVVASLPEEKSFFEVIEMPKLSEEDLKSAILFEAEKYIPLPVDQVYLDCEIISESEKKMEVLLVAVPKNIVNSYLLVLKKAGLKPLAFEVESQAIARALIKEGKKEKSLIVDLGATRTSLIVFFENAIRFTCTIKVAGNEFTRAIAQNLNIPFEKAEKLKIKYGLGEKIKLKFKENNFLVETKKGKIFEILIPCLVDLAQQIKRYLEYYETHNNSLEKKIEKIILCGGGANLKGLTEFLELELKKPVLIGDPWINIGKEINTISPEKSLTFTTAIGLALRGIK